MYKINSAFDLKWYSAFDGDLNFFAALYTTNPQSCTVYQTRYPYPVMVNKETTEDTTGSIVFGCTDRRNSSQHESGLEKVCMCQIRMKWRWWSSSLSLMEMGSLYEPSVTLKKFKEANSHSHPKNNIHYQIIPCRLLRCPSPM